MAITTLATLKSALSLWLHRDASSYAEDLIDIGEKYLFRHARTREMETALSVAISSGVAALPSDYLGLKHAYIDGTPIQRLQRTSASEIFARYPLRSADDKPAFIARDGSYFIFGPYPDSTYTVKGIYYAEPTSILSSPSTFFLNNPDLYLFATLAEAQPFLLEDEPRIAIWIARRDAILRDINNLDTKESFSGGPLQMRVG